MRWSAAKAVARISERLPAEFTSQVVDTVIGLFSIHSIATASLYDMPAIAECTWHGTCLSCAELLRRGLIPSDHLPDVINWIIKVIFPSDSEILIFFFDLSCRLCILTSARGPTPSAPTCATLLRMHCGPYQEPMRPPLSCQSQTNLQRI